MHISAFRGLRYDLGHVGSLAGVVAPSVEIIEADEQKRLYERHPANVVRLIKNRSELGDEVGATHARAARFFRNWQREGVLQREPDPAIYAYHIVAPTGETTRGLICLMRASSDPNEVSFAVKPSEEEITERLELLRLSKASLSMTVGLYSSLESDGLDELEQSIVNVAPIETTDQDERVHRIWPVTDLTRINTATSLLSAAQVVLVGGVADYMASIRWFAECENETNEAMACLFESDSIDPDEGILNEVSCPHALNGLVLHSFNA